MVLSADGYKIVVTGITGNQGGSVFKALKESNKPYAITGITRDVSKPAAKELESQGVKMVSTTLSADNTAEVAKVFAGAQAVFAMTNFWEHTDKAREVKEGKMMVDAAKQANVGLFIYAGLPNYNEITGGKYVNVDHFDGKAEVEAYAKEQGVNIVSVQPAMYTNNFAPQGGCAPRKGEDGNYNLFMPEGFTKAQLSLIDIAPDYGLYVQKVLESGDAGKSGTVLAVSDQISGQEFLDVLSEAAGKKIGVIEVPAQVFRGALAQNMGERVATEFEEMLSAHFHYGYYGKEDASSSQTGLARKPTKWAQYAQTVDWSKL